MLENLVELDVSGNKLQQLVGLKKLKTLKTIYCNNNLLSTLKLDNSKDIETIFCHGNLLKEIDLTGKAFLKVLDASKNIWQHGKNHKHMELAKLEGCFSLERLDLAENDIKNLDFPYLPNLKDISLRENGNEDNANKSLILRSPNLEFLDYHHSDIKEVIFHKDYSLENPQQLRVCNAESYTNPDGNYNPDVATEWEQRAYERQQEKLQQEFEKGEHVYAGQQHLDLSNCDFIKSITIDGEVNYPKSLVSINLGGNYLEEVIVRNLPNLRRLIISHNCIQNLVIENCPQLDQSQFYSYKSGDRDEPIPTQGRVYDDKRDNPIQQEEARKKAEQERLLEQVISCLAQAEEALARQDYQALAKLIEQLKELTQEPIAGISPAKLQTQLNKYEQSLLASQTESVPTVKLLIGGAIITCLVLGSLIWVTSRWVKTLIRKRIDLKN